MRNANLAVVACLVVVGCDSPVVPGLDAAAAVDVARADTGRPTEDGGVERDAGMDAPTSDDAALDASSMPGPDAASARCGDGALDPGEACDDGNTRAGDGCSSDCLVEGDCAHPLELAAIGTPVPGGLRAELDLTGRADVLTPSCSDAGLFDVVVRFTPTRDGRVHARTRGPAALAAYEGCDGGREIDCNYDGAYAPVGLLDFDGTAGVPVDLLVSTRSMSARVELEVREMALGTEGDACDPLGVESICGARLACDGTCEAANDLGCGAGSDAIDLTSLWEASAEVSYAGSFRSATDLGRVSCGRGAGRDAVHVVHLAHATRIRSIGVINLAAALSARTACASGEIGCSLGTRVPSDLILPAGTDLYFVAEQIASSTTDEYILEILRTVVLGEGDPCTTAGGAPPASECAPALACDETSGRCRPTVCNDGVPEGLEACDDGNATDLDGCSASCALEDQGGGRDGCPGAPLRLVPAPGGSFVAYATGTTSGFDDDTNGAMCPGVFMSPDVRYDFSVPSAGTLSVTLDSSTPTWDPALRLHTGPCGGSRVSAPVIACESRATLGLPWTISGGRVGGGSYTVTIDEALSRTPGSYELWVRVTP